MQRIALIACGCVAGLGYSLLGIVEILSGQRILAALTIACAIGFATLAGCAAMGYSAVWVSRGLVAICIGPVAAAVLLSGGTAIGLGFLIPTLVCVIGLAYRGRYLVSWTVVLMAIIALGEVLRFLPLEPIAPFDPERLSGSPFRAAVIAAVFASILAVIYRRLRAGSFSTQFGKLHADVIAWRQLAMLQADGWWIADRHGRVVRAGPAAAGEGMLPAVGESVDDVCDHLNLSSSQKNRCLRAVSGASRAPVVHEVQWKNDAGHWCHGEQTTVTVVDSAGNPDGVLAVIRDTTEHIDRIETLRKNALRDDLTGVLNRKTVLERADHALRSAAVEKSAFTMAMLNLDGFGGINDVHGHTAGDQLLAEVGQRIRDVAVDAYVGRLGGDEFLFVGTSGSKFSLEPVRLALQSTAVEVKGRTVELPGATTVVLSQECVETVALRQWLRALDDRMQAAKSRGGNSCTVEAFDDH